MAWHGMAWHGMVWYGIVWYGMVWYSRILQNHPFTSFSQGCLGEREIPEFGFYTRYQIVPSAITGCWRHKNPTYLPDVDRVHCKFVGSSLLELVLGVACLAELDLGGVASFTEQLDVDVAVGAGALHVANPDAEVVGGCGGTGKNRQAEPTIDMKCHEHDLMWNMMIVFHTVDRSSVWLCVLFGGKRAALTSKRRQQRK